MEVTIHKGTASVSATRSMFLPQASQARVHVGNRDMEIQYPYSDSADLRDIKRHTTTYFMNPRYVTAIFINNSLSFGCMTICETSTARDRMECRKSHRSSNLISAFNESRSEAPTAGRK